MSSQILTSFGLAGLSRPSGGGIDSLSALVAVAAVLFVRLLMVLIVHWLVRVKRASVLREFMAEGEKRELRMMNPEDEFYSVNLHQCDV